MSYLFTLDKALSVITIIINFDWCFLFLIAFYQNSFRLDDTEDHDIFSKIVMFKNDDNKHGADRLEAR